MSVPSAFTVGARYDSLLQDALRHFFARATFETEPIPSASSDGRLAIEATADPFALSVRWFGSRYTIRAPEFRPFTDHEIRFARAIGAVLAARYRAIFDPRLMAERGDLFRGAIEETPDRKLRRDSSRAPSRSVACCVAWVRRTPCAGR